MAAPIDCINIEFDPFQNFFSDNAGSVKLSVQAKFGAQRPWVTAQIGS